MNTIAESIAHLLKEMCDGQGVATISVSWDSASDDPKFDVTATRERDGELLTRKQLTESEFVTLVNALISIQPGSVIAP